MPPRPSVPPLLTTIDLGDRTAPLTARINRRARRLIVSVDAASGRVFVTAPSKRALPDALDFARTRARWICAQLEEGQRAAPFADGSIFPFRGAPVAIVNEGPARAAVRLDGARLIAGGDGDHVNRRVTDWLKTQARNTLTERADYYCEMLGRKRGPISIRDTRSRWGSCAPDGALSFSWRLIFAPPEILNYVAAHECAHLVHLNHSPAYWRVVRDLGVNARSARDWFAAHGQGLYAYGSARADKAA